MQKRIEAEKQRAIREKEDVDNSFRAFRSTLLLFWLVTNAIWVFCMTNYVSSSCYLKAISYVVAVFNITRFLGASVFLVFRIVRRCGGGRHGNGSSTYQHQLPPEWQSHYKRSNAGAPTEVSTRTTTTTTTTAAHVGINMESPRATQYRNMETM